MLTPEIGYYDKGEKAGAGTVKRACTLLLSSKSSGRSLTLS